MEIFDLSALLVTAAAFFAYINHRWLKLPMTIGVMLLSLLGSVLLVIAGALGSESVIAWAENLVDNIGFDKALMHGMLSFLLFAGALHVNLEDLRRQSVFIALMATVGTVGSTFCNGFVAYWVFSLLGVDLPLIYCLLFGALISPTDPIAVIGLLKTAGAPKGLQTQIVGESLFNDGVAVVVFLVLLGIAASGAPPNAADISVLLLTEAVGGIVFGLVIGGIAILALRGLDAYSLEVLITLAVVMGGYALSFALHVSGPLAMVVAGLIVGNHGRQFAMSDRTREHVDTFWELIDEVLNAVLFVLIGVEVLLLTWAPATWAAVGIMIPVVLLTRLMWVGLPVMALRRVLPFASHAIKIITWAGLRGGISVALALSLPEGDARDTVLGVTYLIVVFSIVVQGLTTGPLVKRLNPQPPDAN